MSWTVPELTRPDGSLVAPEPELLPGVLDWHRATLLYKCVGLTGEQLAQAPIAASNLSLLGLIRHLAKVERTWFRQRLRGEPIENLYASRRDADFEDLDPARAEADYGQLLAEQEASRQAAAALPMDASFRFSDEEMSLRMLHLHMIGEYARHNGHADLLRQCVDGTTGA